MSTERTDVDVILNFEAGGVFVCNDNVQPFIFHTKRRKIEFKSRGNYELRRCTVEFTNQSQVNIHLHRCRLKGQVILNGLITRVGSISFTECDHVTIKSSQLSDSSELSFSEFSSTFHR